MAQDVAEEDLGAQQSGRRESRVIGLSARLIPSRRYPPVIRAADVGKREDCIAQNRIIGSLTSIFRAADLLA